MAAPTGTLWGATQGSYARIGLYISVTTNNATTYAGEVQVWYWSKYSTDDHSNTLYFDNLAASGSATTSRGALDVVTTSDSGGWSTTNQIKLKSYSFSYTKGKTAATRYIYAKLSNVDVAGATMYASTTFSVPKKTSYTITYNANGGTGAPSSQTKWHGENTNISTVIPVRNGYTFLGWALTLSDAQSGSVYYYAGHNCGRDENLTLYAVWEANTYTVSYNANGGTGAPANETKKHGTDLTLSSAIPTRENYNFLGWGISASSTTVSYAAGAKYTTNAPVTLYAIWELAYTKPIIYGAVVSRCDSNGTDKDDGTYGLITFSWECFHDVTSIIIEWAASVGTGSKTLTASGKSGSVENEIFGNGELSADVSYTVTITVADSGGNTPNPLTLNGASYPIDVLAGGGGVAFGKPAELKDTAEFAYDAKFNKAVYGKALGMDRLPAITENSDFNNYMEPGCYAVQSNAIAATIRNIPVDRAGRLEVWSSTGEGVRLEQWSYLRQRFIPYNSGNSVWERELTRGEDNVWHYYDWWQSSLTPAAAAKIYTKAAITIALSENITLGAYNTYTPVPFDTTVATTSNRLIIEGDSVRIGANISYIKASGQLLIDVGSVAGNRHARIQKTSNGTTTSHAWTCIYAQATGNTLYPFTPVIIPVKEGDTIKVVYYTGDTADAIVSGSVGNGRQSYLTVEEL